MHKKKEQRKPGYLNYQTMDNHTIYKEKSAEQQPAKRKKKKTKGWKGLRLLTVQHGINDLFEAQKQLIS